MIGKCAEHKNDGLTGRSIDTYSHRHLAWKALQLLATVAQVPVPALIPEDLNYNLIETIQLSQLAPTASPNNRLSCNSDCQDAVLIGRYPASVQEMNTTVCKGGVKYDC